MGAVLSQEQLDQNGKWQEKVIAYASKKLSAAEQSYSSFKVWHTIYYIVCTCTTPPTLFLGGTKLLAQDDQEV